MTSGNNLRLNSVAQMLNFHGTQMLKEMCSPQSCYNKEINLVEIYQELIREHQVDFKEMKLRMKRYRPNYSEKEFYSVLRQFILAKLEVLFCKNDGDLKTPIDPTLLNESSSVAVDFGYVPAFQSFIELPVREEKDKFFKDCRKNDIIYGQIRSRDESGLTVRMVCTDYGLLRILNSFQIEVFIPRSDVVDEEISERQPFIDQMAIAYEYAKFRPGLFVKCSISSVHADAQVMNVTLNGGPLLHLGLIAENDLPFFFSLHASEKNVRNYDKTLRRAREFQNGTVEDGLCSELGLEIRGDYWRSSLLESIKSEAKFGNSAEFAIKLRKDQTHKMSMKSVVKGVDKFKAGDKVAAMQHLEKALSIEENNAEALVARGALYANQESFDMALKDFKEALRVDPDHRNGKKYFVETLLTRARMYESRKKRGVSRSAMDCYKKVLEIFPEHHDAALRLKKLNEDLKSRIGVDRKAPGGKRKMDEDIMSVSSDNESSAATEDADDELSKSLRSYYAKYNHRELSTEQEKELNESGIMDKLKEYYGKYQNRSSNRAQRVPSHSGSVSDEEIKILDSKRSSNTKDCASGNGYHKSGKKPSLKKSDSPEVSKKHKFRIVTNQTSVRKSVESRERSPKRNHSPERNHSPKRNRSPKRNHSPEKNHSPKRNRSPKRNHSPKKRRSPKRRHSHGGKSSTSGEHSKEKRKSVQDVKKLKKMEDFINQLKKKKT